VYVCFMNIIENAYLAIQLQAKPVEPIRKVFLDHLLSKDIKVEVPSSGVHVSLCYSVGCQRQDKLERLAKALASEKIEMRVTGVELLEGMSTPYDYVTLTLESDSFSRAKSKAEGELCSKTFAGGFKVHVSLLQVPKGTLDDVDFSYLNSYLADLAQEFCGCTTLCGEAVSVFDSTRTCRIQFQLPQAA
jgi:hypothetical protein